MAKETIETLKEQGYIKVGSINNTDYYVALTPADEKAMRYHIVLLNGDVPWHHPQFINVDELDIFVKAKEILFSKK